MKIKQFKLEFTKFIPEEIKEGVLYVSMEFSTAAHKCACGCGQEIVTPFSPTDWKLVYDGDSISLTPSIGNWSYPCRAHYFIRSNQVIWAGDMSDEAIDAGRRHDRASKAIYYAEGKAGKGNQVAAGVEISEGPVRKEGGILKAVARFFGLVK